MIRAIGIGKPRTLLPLLGPFLLLGARSTPAQTMSAPEKRVRELRL
jgi:hypothetical protein